MDVMYRDDITNQLQGYYSRRVFFGDLTLKDIKDEKIKESVKKELYSCGFEYLIE